MNQAEKERISVRLPGLDFLRAFAIVWVMLYHLESYIKVFPAFNQYGWMGVDLFFVLSGFLIGSQAIQPYTNGAKLEWLPFMLRRIFRVWPAYLVVLALYFMVPSWRESDGIQPLWQFLSFTVNFFPDYAHNRAYSHAWSLCVEEHFYLLLPPAVWLMARNPNAKKVFLLTIATVAGGMVLRAWLWKSEVAPLMRNGESSFLIRYVETIYNPTYNRLDGLLTGVMLAVVKAFCPRWWNSAMAHGRLLLMIGVAGLFLMMQVNFTSYFGAVAGFPLLSGSLGFIVLGALSTRTIFGRRQIPGALLIANISFSLYLVHKPAYHLMQSALNSGLTETRFLAFCAYNGSALIFAILLYLTVERPSLDLRDSILNFSASRRLAARRSQ